MKVAVIGGSLGGLTIGCLLADDGHDVTIYERSPIPLEERGAGIGLLPTTARYLTERAGISLHEVSVFTDTIQTLRADGSVLHTMPHRYAFSSWNTVYRKLLESFDSAKYVLNRELTSLNSADGFVNFADGSTTQADLVACADGVGSMARNALLGEIRPHYAGYVAWRGVVDEDRLSAATLQTLRDALTYAVYPNSHILVYPIPGRSGSVIPGQRLINIVWYRNYPEGPAFDSLMTDRNNIRRDVSLPPGTARPEHIDEVRATAAAQLPPQIVEVINAIPELFVQVVFDMAVDRMAFDRACILGDAAFAVRPHAAAGTAKAAADAWTLRDSIRKHGDVVKALREWEPGQLALGRSLLARTRAIGARSQVHNNWVPGDPDLIFGLYAAGN